ncbi:MAG: hypothetical protein Q8M95_15630 [Candidatus Methanoperedens sp.]|nr:hypothetical protein [Candidatus Methanoperedens sp.]
MDCCGSSKPEENEKETKTDKMRGENNPAQKEHTHAGGGCCGGGAKDMWVHMAIMLIAMAAIWYFTKR